MKLLTLAPPRSGSSAFHAAVTQAYELDWVTEPFNVELHQNWDGNKTQELTYRFRKEPMKVPDGFSVKSLTFFNHWADPFWKHWQGGSDGYMRAYSSEKYQIQKLKFYLRYMDLFDRTFLLLRRDVGDQLRSMLIGMQKERAAGERLFDHWNQAYDGFDPVLDDEGALHARLLIDSINMIEKISRIRKIPIVYYEDLFAPKGVFDITNQKYNLGLDGTWGDHFDHSKRWRKTKD